MLESSVLRYCVYGSCAIITSELLYYTYFSVKNWLKERSSRQEINEVIWTNELTQSCAAQHRFDNNGSGAASSPSSNAGISRYPSGNIGKLASSSKTNRVACRNPFCATYNIYRLIEYIDSAQYSIDLAMYTFTSYEVSNAFGRAFKRGVLIRIVSDQEMAYSSGSQIIPLTKAGVPVRCNRNTTNLMHHKFCIIDSPTRVAAIHKKQKKFPVKNRVTSLLLTGSLNWTNQGFANNWENILITSKREYIDRYSQEFERLWKVFEVDLK
ncbi:hypothetical protein DOY81_004186 [Sarcophaga bullata]|nr:hypothetical protein DOY81_004186 [Sarcophaga bullata]